MAKGLTLSSDLAAFAQRLGHDFARTELLIRALTHASAGSATRPHNQRLEFLGDRVLGLVIAETLFAADRQATEGQLAPRVHGRGRQRLGPRGLRRADALSELIAARSSP